ncbi:LuxR family transcriptional regulator [Mycobacterium paraffinicum]|uniref:LuxR family transcriptional regulator n=2 Tax=Mycobacterium paraffinicum TaxID=53378 RepID=A0A1Q4HTC3_9MYCO|nr:LuxR family transcriptional regulator [Mycobacterium paraffinicum]
MQAGAQPTQVVATRVQAPTYDDGFVPRARLIELLRSGRAKRVALIHAPAGFGKTTLALQWQRVLLAEAVPVAWLSLDRDDNDVVPFLAHLIEAVRRVEPSLAANLSDLLEQHTDHARRYVLTELVNRIAERHGPLAIVLDDWHLIESVDTAAALEFLFDAGPDNLHLIITSRTQTPAVAKLKVRNQVTEVDTAQLRFDADESAAFFGRNALGLSDDDVRRLWSSTDGWVAALQLATLSLRSCEDPSELVRAFSGRHRAIGDYLAENVLNALPPDLLDVLLTTSICDRLCGELASALSGRPRGQSILEELERRNMFLRPLDDDREWFRYHHLFADHLRRRLECDHPERVVDLHRTASSWFADHGLLGEAVTHAIAAGDAEGAVDLVERHAMPLVEHSRMATLLGLVNKLPKTLLVGRPNLQIAIAWAHCLLHQAPDVRVALDHVRAASPSTTDGFGAGVLGEADVVQACTDVYGDRIDRACGLVAPYIVDNPPYRPFLVAVSANIRTFVDIHTFAYESAQSRQRWANAFHETAGGPFAGVYGRCFAGLAAFAQLDLPTAENRYTEALVLAQNEAGPYSHAARLAGALLGRLHYERGEIDTAEGLLEQCHELGAESGVVDFMIATYSTLARIKVLRGDIDEAICLLDEGHAAAQQLSLPRLSAALDNERVRLHLALGDTGRAQQIIGCRGHDVMSGMDGIAMATRHYQLGMLAQIACAENKFDTAHDLLSLMCDESTAAGWLYGAVVSNIELARVVTLTGDTDASAEILVPALLDGARAGLLRTIVDAGPEILKAIANLRDASRTRRWPPGLAQVPSDYLSRLLATAYADAKHAAIPVVTRDSERAPTPEEPLTPREIEVLRLLDRGMSNKQIARNLGVTINTVKWYLKGIYIKLGATRRGESVSEARRRQLLH